jgi:hypothetical protein
MCTYLTENVGVTGSGKGAAGWFALREATVYFDHPVGPGGCGADCGVGPGAGRGDHVDAGFRPARPGLSRRDNPADPSGSAGLSVGGARIGVSDRGRGEWHEVPG